VQLGIFAKTFPGDDPLTVLRAVRAHGYSSCHYNMACSGLAAIPERVDAQVIADVRDAVDATGTSLCGLSATFNMIHPHPEERERGLRGLNVLAAVAQALSIPVLTLCTGSRDGQDQWRHHPENQSPAAWQDLCQTMAAAVMVADKYNVWLGVEPETANVVNSAAAAEKLLNDMGSDRLKIVVDPANLFHAATLQEQHEIVAETIELLAPYIVMAHAKDRDARGRPVVAGRGVIDFGFYFKQLQHAGFDGPVVTHGLKAEDAKMANTYLERFL
jgi:sugar phosphate isomerase/epimerase